MSDQSKLNLNFKRQQNFISRSIRHSHMDPSSTDQPSAKKPNFEDSISPVKESKEKSHLNSIQQQLISAAKFGNFKLIDKYSYLGPNDFEILDRKQKNCLWHAVENFNLASVISLMFNAKVDPNIECLNGDTALHLAFRLEALFKPQLARDVQHSNAKTPDEPGRKLTKKQKEKNQYVIMRDIVDNLLTRSNLRKLNHDMKTPLFYATGKRVKDIGAHHDDICQVITYSQFGQFTKNLPSDKHKSKGISLLQKDMDKRVNKKQISDEIDFLVNTDAFGIKLSKKQQARPLSARHPIQNTLETKLNALSVTNKPELHSTEKVKNKDSKLIDTVKKSICKTVRKEMLQSSLNYLEVKGPSGSPEVKTPLSQPRINNMTSQSLKFLPPDSSRVTMQRTPLQGTKPLISVQAIQRLKQSGNMMKSLRLNSPSAVVERPQNALIESIYEPTLKSVREELYAPDIPVITLQNSMPQTARNHRTVRLQLNTTSIKKEGSQNDTANYIGVTDRNSATIRNKSGLIIPQRPSCLKKASGQKEYSIDQMLHTTASSGQITQRTLFGQRKNTNVPLNTIASQKQLQEPKKVRIGNRLANRMQHQTQMGVGSALVAESISRDTLVQFH